MKSLGYILIDRKLLNNPIISKSAYFHLWTVLLLLANHSDTTFIWNNKTITLKRGQLLTGRTKLAELTKIKATTIERILKYLENEHMIGQQTTSKFRIITIINYNLYQKADRKTDHKWTTSGQQMDTYNNDNNVNNVNNRESTLTEKKFSNKKDITDTVLSDIAEQYEVDIEFVRDCWDSAVNWLDAKGKVQKNYKAFLSNWVKREKANIILKAKNFSKQRGGVAYIP